MTDADGGESPEQKERTIALAKRLKESMHKTIEHDMVVMQQEQAKFWARMDRDQELFSGGVHPKQHGLYDRIGGWFYRRIGGWFYRQRERVALLLAPWLDRDSMDD